MTDIIVQPTPPNTIVVDSSRGGSVGPTGPQGVQGAQGVQGPPGPALAYTHTQNLPQNIWTIAHGLGVYPQVSVVEFGGANVIGDVAYLDVNTLRVTFTTAVSGYAYLS